MPLQMTPAATMAPLERIAAANAQLSAFTTSLAPATAHATVSALLARQARIEYSPHATLIDGEMTSEASHTIIFEE